MEFTASREQFAEYEPRRQTPTDQSFVVCEISTKRIVGGINLSCIVRGCFQSAFLGYWVGAPFARQGYMTEGLNALVHYAFGELGLHRLEANIQPENLGSIALVRKCGFRREGFSPRYLQVRGEWRDHERWALLADEV